MADEGALVELQLHAVQLEEALVLASRSVARLREDLDQGFPVQVAARGDDRETTDELGDQARISACPPASPC
jgi:hypothetical protein